MKPRLAISDVRFTHASSREFERGLLGYVSCVVSDRLCLDGITVRRSERGRLTLSFPERRTAGGGAYAYIRPVDETARRDIEAAILGAIGRELCR